VLAFLVKLAAAYLLGSLNGSLILGQIRRVDIRDVGSGNAGGTNALRTPGRLFALGVMIIDVGKALLATTWLANTTLFGSGAGGPSRMWVVLGCGAAVVIGHCWPAFYGFRGGKGMATLLGVYAVVAPFILIVVLITWFAVMAITGYVGLATVLGAAAAPLAVFAFGGLHAWPLLAFAIAMAALILFTHRSNMARLRRGEETRFSRSWLARR
jgi:glycerol-3-phosphate acyltransferase PlsY